jgi:hypothetical protein
MPMAHRDHASKRRCQYAHVSGERGRAPVCWYATLRAAARAWRFGPTRQVFEPSLVDQVERIVPDGCATTAATANLHACLPSRSFPKVDVRAWAHSRGSCPPDGRRHRVDSVCRMGCHWDRARIARPISLSALAARS